jgi:hypothetical protein
VLDYEKGLQIARLMKARNSEIIQAIRKVKAANHGVVALKFSNGGREMEIVILDEPYDDNVRVFPGD